MNKKNKCLDNDEWKCYLIGETKGVLKFKGWDINNPEELVSLELEKYLEKEVNFVKILNIKEDAYSCPNYMEGMAAKDEGYTHFIECRKDYVNGLGKCSHINFEFEMMDDEHY